MGGDRIELRGLRATGTHGVLPEEQSRPQPFEVDVDVEADLARAGRSDALADTLDYGALAEAVVRIVEQERFALLERLAERIAEAVLTDDRARSVLPELYEALRGWLAAGERVLLHEEELGDRLMGVAAGYLLWSGLIPDGPQAIVVLERLVHRQMGPAGRQLVALAPSL